MVTVTGAKPGIRLLTPPDKNGYQRKVEIHPDRLKEKLADGYVVDPDPDTRVELRRKAEEHKDRPAFIIAGGPSAGLIHPDAVGKFIADYEPVVFATNNVFNVLGGHEVPTCHYHTVLDDAFWAGNYSKIIDYYSRHPETVALVGFQMQQSFPHIEINTNLVPVGYDYMPPYTQWRYFHGMSSGCASVQFAIHARCNPIYLLGHDLTAYQGMTHGFGVRCVGELKQNYPQGKIMIDGYNLAARHAKELGIDIVNLSPISVLDCFRKAKIEDFV